MDLAQHTEDTRRRCARRTVIWQATIEAGHANHICWVRNISRFGMAIESPTALPVHMPVCVALERYGAFDGFIAWREGPLHGVLFVHHPQGIVACFGPDALTFGLCA